MVPADALGHLPVERRRLRPRAADDRPGPLAELLINTSAETRSATTSGRSTARPSATAPPIEWPTTMAPRRSSTPSTVAKIVDQPVEAERRRHRRRAAESSLVDGNHAPTTRHQPRRQRSEDPEVGAVTVQQHYRPAGAALLGVQHCRRRAWRWPGCARPERRSRCRGRDPAWHRAGRGHDARRPRPPATSAPMSPAGTRCRQPRTWRRSTRR